MYNNQRNSRSFFLKQYRPRSRGVFTSVVVLGVLIGIILFAYASFADDVNDTNTLELVVLYHRHGDRTPTKMYKKDPYHDWKKYWPIGLGQLTLRGKRQMFALGKVLKQHYMKFISKFTVRTVRVESSDADRCLMSVGALLAAMFPPTDDQIWNKDLDWQPIPIHTIPRNMDRKFSMKAPCPRYKMEYDKIIKESIENTTEPDKKLFKYLSDHSGWSVKSVREIETLYSILKIEDENGLTLPEWTKDVFPSTLKEKAAESMALFSYNTLLQRLRGGPIMNDLFDTFVNKSMGRLEDLKLIIYSGHDIGLVTVFRAFGFNELFIPDFGATFIFELHKQNDEHFFKMLYLNTTTQAKPYELQIPNCMSPCPLDTLVKLTEPVRPMHWEEECKVD